MKVFIFVLLIVGSMAMCPTGNPFESQTSVREFPDCFNQDMVYQYKNMTREEKLIGGLRYGLMNAMSWTFEQYKQRNWPPVINIGFSMDGSYVNIISPTAIIGLARELSRRFEYVYFDVIYYGQIEWTQYDPNNMRFPTGIGIRIVF